MMKTDDEELQSQSYIDSFCITSCASALRMCDEGWMWYRMCTFDYPLSEDFTENTIDIYGTESSLIFRSGQFCFWKNWPDNQTLTFPRV